MKKWIALCLALCALLLAACGSQKTNPMSTADLVQIVLDDLDTDIAEAQPHVHSSEIDGKEVCLVYVTVDGESLAYALDPYTGEILGIQESNHSH